MYGYYGYDTLFLAVIVVFIIILLFTSALFKKRPP